MIIYGTPPCRVPYGMDIDSYIKEYFKTRESGNRELLVVDTNGEVLTSGEVMGCITGPKLLRLYLTKYPGNVCKLTKQHYEDICTTSHSSLNRNKILKIILRRKRSLFVFKKGTKRGRFSTIYFRDIEAEINENLTEPVMHEQRPNYPGLIEYTI